MIKIEKYLQHFINRYKKVIKKYPKFDKPINSK